MSPDFLHIMRFSLRWETGDDANGGYTNNPRDPGGETKWGISKRSYPDLDIAAVAHDQAIEIYHADYWLGTGRQKSYCNVMSAPLNAAHFDCVVNVGNWKTTRDGQPLFHGRANMILQRALGVDDDGVVGPLTLAAIQKADPKAITDAAIAQREAYYRSLTNLAEFLPGWLNRTRDLKRFIGGA